jgi:hypothetical protein
MGELSILFFFQLPKPLKELVRGRIKFHFLLRFIQFDEVVGCQKFCEILNLAAV